MLPSITQRVMILLALGVGALCWASAGDGSAWADGGPWLLSGDAATLLLLGVPAVLLGLWVSVTGHPVAGMFVCGGSLMLPAWIGGPIDPWLYASEQPGGYIHAIIESFVWAVLIAGMAMACRIVRSQFRDRLSERLASRHFGASDPWFGPMLPTLIGFMLATAVGLGMTFVLVQSSATGQVTWSVFVAFVVAGLVSQVTVRGGGILVVLLSPMLAAVLGYGYTIMSHANDVALLSAWYSEQLMGWAMVRPIDYASAGLAGCAIGIGVGQALDISRQSTQEQSAGPIETSAD